MSYLECRDGSTGRVLGSPSSSPTFPKRQYCYLSVTKTLPKTGSHSRLVVWLFFNFFFIYYLFFRGTRGCRYNEPSGVFGGTPCTIFVVKNKGRNLQGCTPPLRVKKKLRVKGEGVVKNWFAAFSESNVGPRVSEVLAMNSCLLNNEWWLLRPTVRILSILRLKMTLLSLGLKENKSRWTFSRRMVKICQFSCLTANFWPFYDQQLIPLKFLRIFA